MKQLTAGLLLSTLAGSLLAAVGQTEDGAAAPTETVGMVWVVLFLVIFFGSIAGFFLYLWYCERKREQDKKRQ
jgi:drug/metabolite transporter (DMT)-like permease